MTTTVLVTGATGSVGSELARILSTTPGLRVRAMVRDIAKARPLADVGVELVAGTFEDPASLVAAMTGIDTLALITAAGAHAADQASRAIAAAKQAGVRKIVRLSAIKASVDGPTDNTRQHARTERELRESGLVYVALRPSFFMQNLVGLAASVPTDGKLYAGVGTGKVAMIDTRDVAEAMAAAVTSATYDNQALELSGPASVSFAEVAAALAAALGRPVEYIAVPPAAAGEALRKFGADDWTVQLMTDYFTAYGKGFGDFVTDLVPRMTGHPARGIEAFAREAFATAKA
jgi:NAD(P)H dehydrogenase (quinone)